MEQFSYLYQRSIVIKMYNMYHQENVSPESLFDYVFMKKQ